MIEENEEIEESELFEGMLTDGIWQRLAIEEKVKEMQAEWKEITAQNVAKELTDQGSVIDAFSAANLLQRCENYLRKYNDPFAGIGFVPKDLKFMTDSGKSALFKVLKDKSNLYKAHAAKLDVCIKDRFGDDVH